jgi:hypothetical protein
MCHCAPVLRIHSTRQNAFHGFCLGMTVLQWFLRLAAGRFAAMYSTSTMSCQCALARRAGETDEKLEGDWSMVRGNRYIAAGLAAGLAFSALATPSFAQRAEGQMSGQREKALRDCGSEAGKMSQSTWGVQQLHKHRSCMMQRGEQE